jgi:PII-like signaling protein
MTPLNITVVRIYLTEAEHKLKQLLSYLHDESQVRGVTVFRGISGFGKSGKVHSASLLDLSMDLPIVVEFFDNAEKVRGLLPELEKMVDSGHLIYWPAYINAVEEVRL